MIDKRLNVLMLEDAKTDEALIKRQLLKVAPNSIITVARNQPDFIEKLEWLVPDLIISDYTLPDMNGLEALLQVREHMTLVPFIFVTGALNDEEKVANSILKGASAYVLKENLKQLPDKIIEVLNKAEEERTAATEEERRWREAGLSLQKAIAKLEKAPGFDQKEDIIKLLEKVLIAVQE